MEPKLESPRVCRIAVHTGFEFEDRGALLYPFPRPRIPGAWESDGPLASIF
jgi:hypothetical protein